MGSEKDGRAASIELVERLGRKSTYEIAHESLQYGVRAELKRFW